ncbi:MAG: hypothetical protein CSA24_00910 [Deltaproteobacteria bacterium]|nr:MAG: hypothetical protein CSA24_00910 [Deltaproteobacteria bacterium]
MVRVRYSLEVSVLVDGEPMLATQVRDRSLTIGADPRCALSLATPFDQLELLERLPGGQGFGLHLAPGLRGKIRVGGRTLRIADGLLADPRPEPLRFADGDRGVLLIGDRLQLRFALHRQQRAFKAPFLLPRDRSLGLALGATAVLLLGVVMAIVSRPLPPERHPSRLRLVKVQPPLLKRMIAQERKRQAPPKALAKKPVGKRGSIARPHVVARRGARRRSGRVGRARARHTVRSIDRLLSGLTRLAGATPTATLPSPRGRRATARRGRPSADPLAALDKMIPTASASSSTIPGLAGRRRLLFTPKRRPLPRTLGQQAAGLTRRQIRDVVARHSAAIRGCYERELLRSRRPVQGTLLVQWRIDDGGRVSETKVARDRLRRPDLKRCVLREISRWRFPRCGRAGGCKVIFPFEFFARS